MKTKQLRFYLMALMLGLFSWTASAATVIKTVGTGGSPTQDYATLGAAFTAINTNTAGVFTGADIVLQVSSNTTETAQALLNAGTWTSLTVYPTTTGIVIGGSVAGALIQLAGADNVTFNGAVGNSGSTKSMTIQNTNAFRGVIVFTGDVTAGTIKNCIVKGGLTAATSGNIYTSGATGNGIDNLLIDNNDITSYNSAVASRMLMGVLISGAGTATSENIQVTNNNIFDFLNPTSAGSNVGIYMNGLVNSATITGNSIYETTNLSGTIGTSNSVEVGIYINSASSTGLFTVSNNYFGGSAASCLGANPMRVTGVIGVTANKVINMTGIIFTAADYTTPHLIQNNTIANINLTEPITGAAGGLTGINIASATGKVDITGNTIGSLSANDNIVFNQNFNGGSFNGIYLSGTSAATQRCNNNNIGGIKTTSNNATTGTADAVNIYGIQKVTAAASVEIKDNVIGGTVTNSINAASTMSVSGGTVNTQSVFGIQSSGSTATITGNAIRNLTNASINSTTSNATVCYGIYSTSTGATSISTNTIYNLKNTCANTTTNANTVNVGGIYLSNTTSGAAAVDNNIIHDLSATNATAAVRVNGIVLEGVNATTSNSANGNFIYNLTTPNAITGAGGTIYALRENSATIGHSTSFINNIISLTESGLVYGLYVAGIAHNAYHNTIYIGGSSSLSLSACYYNGTAAARVVKNNIFYNARVGSAALYNYAYFIHAATSLTSDYNDCYAPNTNGKISNGGTNDLAGLKTATGGDTHTVNTNPNFTLSSPTVATDYKSTVTLTGTDVSVTKDYNNADRTALAYQMGAWDASSASAPAAATITTVTPGNTSLSVAFTAGANNGSPISNYEYSTNGSSYTAFSPAQTTSPLSITGLTNGTSYPITIKAVNGIGTGTASNSISGTPATTASAATITAASLNNGTCTVTFTAPSSDGGVSISNYKYSTDGSSYTALSPAQTSSPLSIPLANGSNYTVYIKAVNAAGDGAASNSFAANQTVASVPTITSVTSGANATLNINFTAPTTDGGSTITNYEYSINGGTSFAPRPAGTTASPITITGLQNNTSYDVQIKAVNGIGSSTATATTSQTTWLAPNAPTVTSVTTAGSGELKVYFTAPVNGGGSAITNYSYTLTGANPYTTCSPTVTTSPITITGLTNGQTYTIRLRAINSTGAGINSNSLTGTPTANITVSSSGNISDQPVSSATILTVNDGAELTVNQNTAVNSITVAPGGKLTLNDGITLSTTGGFTLQNNASGTASFVDSRTDDPTPSAIPAIVEQEITDANRNWYVALPVTGQTATNITLSGSYIVKRNESGAGSWTNVTGSLTAGVGYIAVASATGGATTWTLAGGNLNSGKVEVALTRSGTSSIGFNLVGNPYPSYLNWEQVLNQNATNASLVQPSIWYRTASYNSGTSTFDYSFNTYNSVARVATPTTTTGYIPPMQAFWVRANNAGTLTFTNNMRSHGNGSINKLKAPSSNIAIQPLVRIQIANTVTTDEAVLYFNSNALDAVDNYDTPKMFESASASKPEIFTQVDTEKLVINGLHSIPYETKIPVGIVTKQNGEFSITANEVSNFEYGTSVILFDNQNPNVETELTNGSSYIFNAPVTTATTSRFSLMFRAPESTTGFGSGYKPNAQVYVNSANQISIKAPEKSSFAIYNAMGILVENGNLNSNQKALTVGGKLASGVYIVKIAINEYELTTRVIIK